MKKGWPLFLLTALVFYGCGVSQSSRFYALHALATPPEPSATAAAADAPLIGLGPVAVPDRINRPQITSLSGENEIVVAEFDRWSGSLPEAISRTVVENLTILLPAYRVVSLPWGRRLNVQRQIPIDILRMDGKLGDQIILKANWGIAVTADDGARTALVRHTEIVERIAGADYASYVAAQSRALAKLSREIAAAVHNLPR
ncbi:MAG: PqiC family protein [Pseudomonadota bacterium]|nr:PqiC family protein [Pseudomonadota bacterium]